jgi:glutamate-ammonia-ligase adenylyltransferase
MRSAEAEARLDALRAVSAAAARVATRRPLLLRFTERPPSFRALARVPTHDEALARAVLRQARSRLLIHTAYAEGHGESPLVTAALWSAFGDASLKLADRVVMHQLEGRYGAPVTDDGRPVGRAIFGLGKLGAEELNPSSDIDVLFAYGTDAGRAGNGDQSLHELYGRWAKGVRHLLADVDDEGFVFRVDLDLRPEGARGALVNSIDAIEAYYERFGQTWERAALLRLRPIVDHGGVGGRVIRRLRPFIFPKSPRPRPLLESLADMRARIAATAKDTGFDVKRSVGAIRDVEFRVQALQLLYGGRIPDLRTGSTVALLGSLRALGLLSHKTALELEDGYVFLRRVEHALQYGEDRQTQWLPDEGGERQRVAATVARAIQLPGGARAFTSALEAARAQVRAGYDELFHELGHRVAPEALLALDGTARDEQRLEALARLGFANAELALAALKQLAAMPNTPLSPAVQARDARARPLAARLLEQAARSPHPSRALSRLPDLFRSLGRDNDRWALLDDERLSGLLIRVMAASPSLTQLLIRGAAPLELLARGPRRRRRSRVRLAEAMEDPEDDEEEALERLRRVKAQETLGIGLGFLDGRLDLVDAGHRLSTVADAVVQQALFIAIARVARRFGELKGAEVSVLALGRLGGRELGFLSDLDLLFVWDGEGETDGRRAIDAREWAGRVAQQCVWALTAPLVQGAAYDVDTRLRPSGSKGPLCVRLAQLEKYHAQESELWERQALLKLRPIAGSRALGHRVVDVARQALRRPAPDDLGNRLLDMRQRMIAERTRPGTGFDLKMSDGGVADVEFAIQGLQLRHAVSDLVWAPSTRRALRQLQRRGYLKRRDADALAHGLELLTRAREGIQLVSEGQQDAAVERDDPRLEMLSRVGGLKLPGGDGEALFAACIDAAVRVREAASRVLVTL